MRGASPFSHGDVPRPGSGRPRRRFGVLVLSLVTVAALVTGCGVSVIEGTAVPVIVDPSEVGGLPTSTGPSGPREGAPDAQRTVINTDGSDIDVLSVNALADIEDYWQTTYPQIFGGSFTPARELLSWDAFDRRSPEFCGEDTAGFPNAGFCVTDQSIGWDRGALFPELIDAFGPMAVVVVLAHEYGHSIQYQSGLINSDTPGIVAEQQADCFAGAFIRHVAQDRAQRFTINTTDGLSSVLETIVSVRDATPGDPTLIHGSAFERVTATQMGFINGARICTSIDMPEIDSRRGTLPQSFTGIDDDGELPVTQQTLEQFTTTFSTVLGLDPAPTVDFSGAELNCTDAQTTHPVSYCPSTDTIGVDVAALAAHGVPLQTNDLVPRIVRGDFGAYILFLSRMVLAQQNRQGKPLQGASIALRTACLSGVATAALSPDVAAGQPGIDVLLSPGDLDEAVSGLLDNGLAAADVDGNTVLSGFTRVEAFRIGVLQDQFACTSRYN